MQLSCKLEFEIPAESIWAMVNDSHELLPLDILEQTFNDGAQQAASEAVASMASVEKDAKWQQVAGQLPPIADVLRALEDPDDEVLATEELEKVREYCPAEDLKVDFLCILSPCEKQGPGFGSARAVPLGRPT